MNLKNEKTLAEKMLEDARKRRQEELANKLVIVDGKILTPSRRREGKMSTLAKWFSRHRENE